MEMVVQKIEPERLLLVHLASLCDRPEGGLFEGDSDAGGVHAGEECEGNAAEGYGVGLRQDSERAPAEAFRMNDNGWAQQLKNIESYVAERAVAAGRR